jgi:hypothetical protein
MTAVEIFELTLGLIDEDDQDGAYEARVLPLLRILRSEIVRVLSRGAQVPELDSLDDELGLPDDICESVVTYGVAANLLLEEDPARASFFESKYEEELVKAVRRTPGEFAAINDIYGGIEYGEFGSWLN